MICVLNIWVYITFMLAFLFQKKSLDLAINSFSIANHVISHECCNFLLSQPFFFNNKSFKIFLYLFVDHIKSNNIFFFCNYSFKSIYSTHMSAYHYRASIKSAVEPIPKKKCPWINFNMHIKISQSCVKMAKNTHL